jgi:ribosomal protein L35
MSIKTRKSYTKRLKVTKNGKVLARKPGQNHFNAKNNGRKTMDKRRTAYLKIPNKEKSHFLVGF